jgi:hypothetical protein
MLAAALALGLASIPPSAPPGAPAPAPAAADSQAWTIRVATWNLLNFGDSKAKLPPSPPPVNDSLLDRYASIMSQYDIVVVQELLGSGAPLTVGVAQRPAMANYNCSNISVLSGRGRGRQERYGICYATKGIALNGVYDYMGTTVRPILGGHQTAQNVWMRPPIRASFTYTRPDSTPFTFSVYVSHTKPAYSAGLRPLGTPHNAPTNSSVFYELTSLQQNERTDTLAMVVGDLNADCASYPAQYRGRNFPPPGWTWYVNYGEKTNTAPLSSCAYDRIILNARMVPFYKGHGIYTQGIDVRRGGERVSDHYLVWVSLGGTSPKRKRLLTSTAGPLTTSQRVFQAQPRKRVRINAINLNSRPAISSGNLYIVRYTATANYGGNQTYPLTDVRGAPTPVTVSGGHFTSVVSWDTPVRGNYTLVLDVNGDGNYNKNDGDFVNHDNEIDFIVVDGGTAHSDVVTLGDNGQARELFSEEIALNVYALGRGLPHNDSVNAWVVSARLLPPGFSWSNANGLKLDSVSIPVNVEHGPILVGDLRAGDKFQRLRTSPEGTLFAAVWPSPYRLMNTPVFTAPPSIPVYEPGYALATGADPCENAWKSKDTNFQAVCNVGSQFTDYYGTSFNVVLDVDRDGVFGSGDKVDVHDVSGIAAFFADSSHVVLDQRADGNPAVGEYKDYLDSKLNLSTPLPDNNIYDLDTRMASSVYLCSPGLPRSRFPLVQQGALSGFRMLNQADYLAATELESELYAYAAVDMHDVSVNAGTNACITSEHTVINGLSVEENATVTVVTNHAEVGGTVRIDRNSRACVFGNRALVAAGTTLVFVAAAPGPISKGVFALLTVASAAAGGVARYRCNHPG